MTLLSAIIQQAERIASDFLQEQVISSYPILDKGMVNQVYVVETAHRKVVVRMNDEGAYAGYMQEQWCIEQSAAAGVPGPEVLAIGIADGAAYMIQSFVEGENGLDSTMPKSDIWKQIGRYTKHLLNIPVKGYGENLVDADQGVWSSPPHPGSDGTWLGYVQHNINSLKDDDPLIALGVYAPMQSLQVRQIFESIRQETFQFGLTHNDLSLKNTIIDQAGQVTLIDWGNAAVSPVPHGDIVGLMLHQLIEQGLSDEEFRAFLDGYGIHEQSLASSRQILLLKTFDTVRWAIDRAPDLIDTHVGYAKLAVRLLISNGEITQSKG
ncbi:hypothetical protein PCCS19_38500 [Paenibacillus sp. CCS19]|uniref:phosphotransferase family protein n=1 Tax=Paenibacillus sp. CCS19 TaxID=3158387 RepID=UPI00256DDEFA|nr:aminoglycoside phosphotransferase family protein [Paenibacillus cellulosilyticus]GMK40794.1 hypothetical protein PCCS19_38500 [Paenibacillus cellulosilyticus]